MTHDATPLHFYGSPRKAKGNLVEHGRRHMYIRQWLLNETNQAIVSIADMCVDVAGEPVQIHWNRIQSTLTGAAWSVLVTFEVPIVTREIIIEKY